MKHVLAAALALVAAPALAHTDHGEHGLAAGLLHPVLGADHLLALVAVGLWAAVAAPGRVWIAPAGVLAGMFGGGLLGFAGLPVPGVEPAILASVVGFGLLALGAVRAPALAAAALAAAFGMAHGVAHGAELPAGVGAAAYAAGLLLATAVLQAAGALGGAAAARFGAPALTRAAGGATAIAGVVLALA